MPGAFKQQVIPTLDIINSTSALPGLYNWFKLVFWPRVLQNVLNNVQRRDYLPETPNLLKEGSSSIEVWFFPSLSSSPIGFYFWGSPPLMDGISNVDLMSGGGSHYR